jgi:hypothetical protein
VLGKKERQHTQTTSEGTIQVVIAAALPPTLGAQPVEIANQPFIRAEQGDLEHRTIMGENVLTFCARLAVE